MDKAGINDENVSLSETILLQDLSQQVRNDREQLARYRTDDVTDIQERARLNVDEYTRRQLLDDVLGLLKQNVASVDNEGRSSIQTQLQNPTTSQGSQSQDDTPLIPNQISNVLIPLKDGYKLDLRDTSTQSLPKNMKIKFDANGQNVRVKNVMKDVAKYGDQHAKNHTAVNGVLTISVLLHNLSQLKTIIKSGPDDMANFWLLAVLVPVSLIVQLIGGFMVVYLGRMDTDTNEQIRHLYSVGRWLLYVSTAASVINTATASLWLSE